MVTGASVGKLAREQFSGCPEITVDAEAVAIDCCMAMASLTSSLVLLLACVPAWLPTTGLPGCLLVPALRARLRSRPQAASRQNMTRHLATVTQDRFLC